VTKIEEEKQAARRESAMEIISRDEKNREVMACVASNKSTLIIGRNSVVAAPEERGGHGVAYDSLTSFLSSPITTPSNTLDHRNA
jgi:hypothetical protein